MESSDAHPEIYTPLEANSIRVLTILPAKRPSAKINCTLSNISLASDTSLAYSALSYAWGEAEKTDAVLINGFHLTIRANLLAILKSLRFKDRARHVWIDAICINQHDIKERNAQVKIMSNVYRKAETVLAWLGDDDKTGIGRLFNYLTGTKGHLSDEFNEDRIFSFSSYQADDLSGPPTLSREMTPHKFGTAFIALHELRYWTRLWIIQEILSASTVLLLCGNKSLPIEYLVKATGSIKASSPPWYRSRLATAGHMALRHADSAGGRLVNEVHLRRQSWLLGDLIRLCSQCRSNCQDPRDRIYGILSLASDCHEILPDYNKGMLELYVQLLGSKSLIHYRGSGPSDQSINEVLGVLPQPDAEYHSGEIYLVPEGPSHYKRSDQPINEVLGVLLQPYAKHHLEQIYIVPDGDEIKAELNPHNKSSQTTSEPRTVYPLSIITDGVFSYETKSDWFDMEAKTQTEAQELAEQWLPMNLMFHDNSTPPRSHDCSTMKPDLSYKGNMQFHQTRIGNTRVIVDNSQNPNEIPIPNLAEWEKELRMKCNRSIVIDEYLSFIGEEETMQTFLTLHGAVGIGHWGTSPGDILCYVSGTDEIYVVVRPPLDLKSTGPFILIGMAMLLQRKGGGGE